MLSCDHKIEDSYISSYKDIRYLRIHHVQEISDLIYEQCDFLTAFQCGAPVTILKKLLQPIEHPIQWIRDFNSKCKHKDKILYIPIDSSDDESDTTAAVKVFPCCTFERDERVLSENDIYNVLKLFKDLEYPVTFRDIGGLDEESFNTVLRASFGICKCMFANLREQYRTYLLSLWQNF